LPGSVPDREDESQIAVWDATDQPKRRPWDKNGAPARRKRLPERWERAEAHLSRGRAGL